MAGDVGFDPLGLSSIAGLAGADLYWMREAELKHCRVAMLAVSGVLWCETFGSLPGFPSGANQMKLFWEVWAEKPQYVAFGFILAGIIESKSCGGGRGLESGGSGFAWRVRDRWVSASLVRGGGSKSAEEADLVGFSSSAAYCTSELTPVFYSRG